MLLISRLELSKPDFFQIFFQLGLPTIFHIFSHVIPCEERSRAFGYLIAFGSIGQTVASLVKYIKNFSTVFVDLNVDFCDYIKVFFFF